jgi:nitrite reductase (NADH) small subunit
MAEASATNGTEGPGGLSATDGLSTTDGSSTNAADGTWVATCAVTDIPVLGARIVRGRSFDIAVFRTADDRVFALLDRCPHRGGPLSQGIVYGDHVACPLHNWQIGLASGEALAPDQGCTRRFEVRVAGGIVQLRREALTGPSPMPGDDGTRRTMIAVDPVAG